MILKLPVCRTFSALLVPLHVVVNIWSSERLDDLSGIKNPYSMCGRKPNQPSWAFYQTGILCRMCSRVLIRSSTIPINIRPYFIRQTTAETTSERARAKSSKKANDGDRAKVKESNIEWEIFMSIHFRSRNLSLIHCCRFLFRYIIRFIIVRWLFDSCLKNRWVVFFFWLECGFNMHALESAFVIHHFFPSLCVCVCASNKHLHLIIVKQFFKAYVNDFEVGDDWGNAL